MMKAKRAATVGLTVWLAVSAVMSAFGAVNKGTDIIDKSKTGSVTVHKYDEEASAALPDADGEESETVSTVMAQHAVQGVEYTYLRLGDVQTKTTAQSDGEHIAIYYDLPDAFAAILSLSGSVSIEGQTGKFYTVDAISAALKSALTGDNAISTKNAIYTYLSTAQGTGTAVTGADGSASITGLPLGLYLFAETKVPQNISTSNPFLVSLPMTKSNGDEWLYDVHAYPKNQHDEPTLDKQVKTDHSSAYGDYASAAVGDTVDYRIIVKVPNVEDAATYLSTWKITDTLDAGLDYVKPMDQSVTIVKVYDSEAAARSGETESTSLIFTNQDYQITWSTSAARTMQIALTSTGLAKLNAPSNNGKYLVYSYQAQINANAVLGDACNDNTAKLTWGRTNTGYTQTIEDKARVYSYALDLTKLLSDDPDNAAELLPSVQFTLYNETKGHQVSGDVTENAGTYKVNEKNTTDYIFSPDSNGSLKIEGLSAGTYALTEVKSASGYSLLKEPVKIVITSSVAAASAGTAGHNDNNASETVRSTAAAISTTTAAEAAVDTNSVAMTASGSSAHAYVPVTITNTKTWIPALPKTGGRGTLLLVLLGAALVGLCANQLNRKKVTANH